MRLMSLFLSPAEISTLTGRGRAHAQIDSLRKMGIRFVINALGRPVIARAWIEGNKTEESTEPIWSPAIINAKTTATTARSQAR